MLEPIPWLRVSVSKWRTRARRQVGLSYRNMQDQHFLRSFLCLCFCLSPQICYRVNLCNVELLVEKGSVVTPHDTPV